MRSLVALLVVVGLVAAGWFVLREPRQDEPRSEQQSNAAEPEAKQFLPIVSQPAPIEAATPEAKRTAAPVAPPVENEFDKDFVSPDTPGAKGDLVEGTVLVVDAQGIEHRDAGGSFEATCLTRSRDDGVVRIGVTDGQFRLRGIAGSWIRIGKLALDGRVAIPDSNVFEVKEGIPVEVRAVWVPSVFLHVVDARTRQELRGVTVVSNSAVWALLGVRHPAADNAENRLADGADSPLHLPTRANDRSDLGEQSLFARAPGYSWGSMAVDFKQDAEATIELVEGANVDVTIVGEVPPLANRRPGTPDRGGPSVVLRLRTTEVEAVPALEEMVAEATRFTPLTDETRAKIVEQWEERVRVARLGRVFALILPDPDGSTRIEGLAPGRVKVALERGDNWDSPQVLAETVLEVVIGIDAHVTLTIEPPREVVRRVRLAGLVHFSTNWNSNLLNLDFAPVAVPGSFEFDDFELTFNKLLPVSNETGLYRFDASEVLPGRYLVRTYPYRFQQVVDTGPDGTESARIVIGDPADVVVHALDDRSGMPIGRERLLWWNCKRPEESPGASGETAKWDESTQAWCFRAPAGDIELSLNYHVRTEFEPIVPGLFTVQPGHNEITIRLRHATGLLLSVEFDGKPIDWLSALDPAGKEYFDLVAVDADRGLAEYESTEDDTVAFRVPTPGRWRVMIPRLAGYEPVAPFEVTLVYGEMLKKAIKLRRAK